LSFFKHVTSQLRDDQEEKTMKDSLSFNDRIQGALWGIFISDALAMPVHWYYDTLALLRDYGTVKEYLEPRNPHPDSILWRSSYTPPSSSTDILHDQAVYWGQKNIHYHQFLKAGENTLNVKLARELLLLLQRTGKYSAEEWLSEMISYLTSPGKHNDTYVEEYLREYFTNLGRKLPPEKCGRQDEKHIGGFSLMLPLLLACADDPERARSVSLHHLALTHGGELMQSWGKFLIALLLDLLAGKTMKEAMASAGKQSPKEITVEKLQGLLNYPDTTVVGMHFSSACYVDVAVPATLFLALKYQNLPEDGLIANTMCGGDNCGRGSVLGAIFGAMHGMKAWPAKWIDGLLEPPPFVQI
jgi:ADP-ribosyl-[dinitrogen reductase] hydrolase